ncbi:creatininase family protein [Streptomyces rugosispiralis]|uniref:Creatininase family protein n=1 Tax=Streptomyces rugosispiralis TaxID=2967341 RepID=A0ABT1V399_9ACTN|nr:creatininase family protein [Streptomyces rugosispiralis]MCQ8191855.1 creatininase family protein [Streptomyces rugosispiralis]
MSSSAAPSPAIGGEISRELSAPIAVTGYFMAGQARIAEILEDQDALMHACEGETSMAMAITPDLVDEARLAEAVGPENALQADPSEAIHVPRPFHAVTSSGVAGDARRASAEKGEAILDACAEALAEWLMK